MADTYLIDHSNRGKVLITGEDRISFLHNILTHDIQSLKTGEGCYAALLTATAKVLAVMNVHLLENFILLDTDPGVEDKLIPLLEKFIIAENVEIRKVKSSIHYTLTGKSAGTILQEMQAELPEKNFRHKTVSVSGIPFWIFRQNEKTYHLWTEHAGINAVELILDAGTQHGLTLAGGKTAETLRIESGELRYGVDIDESIALPETGLDDIAASETKGCYPGQEVVARTKTYKGLQKKMTRFIVEGETIPSHGDKIFAEEKEIGRITSACKSSEFDSVIALGYAAKGYFDTGREVLIQCGGTQVKAETSELRFGQ